MIDFLYTIFGKLSSYDISYKVLILNYLVSGFCGFLVVLLNSFFGFSYLRDKLHLYLGILLPIIGYSITLIIGSNIALSLGMIGALSIIRFRTPVRSSYELVIYFLLLTIGITTSVDGIVAIILTITSILVLFILSLPIGVNLSKYNTQRNEEKIILNFSMQKENQNIETLISENKGVNISINKENKNYIINGTLEFLNYNEMNKFLKNNEKSIISYEIYKN